jgi:hypothetical protein
MELVEGQKNKSIANKRGEGSARRRLGDFETKSAGGEGKGKEKGETRGVGGELDNEGGWLEDGGDRYKEERK